MYVHTYVGTYVHTYVCVYISCSERIIFAHRMYLANKRDCLKMTIQRAANDHAEAIMSVIPVIVFGSLQICNSYTLIDWQTLYQISELKIAVGHQSFSNQICQIIGPFFRIPLSQLYDTAR